MQMIHTVIAERNTIVKGEKRSKAAAAKHDSERMRKAQEAPMKSDLKSKKTAAEKKQALDLRERESRKRGNCKQNISSCRTGAAVSSSRLARDTGHALRPRETRQFPSVHAREAGMQES
jgi:hypothetical protein